MAKVGISVKVYPESVEVDMEKLKERILALKDELKAERIEVYEQPIAFGLKALIIGIIRDDKYGTEGIEETISKVEGVGEVEIMSASLV